MSIWRWADYFSTTPAEHQITIGEGDTPLVKSHRIGPKAGLKHLYFKLEISNPTGSYKDRFAAAAISDMLACGKTRSIGTSSGNTGSAVAAYCAAAGISCEIAIIETAPMGKLKQMLAYGADIYKVKDMGLDPAVSAAINETLRQKASRPDAKLQISAFACSPDGMAGVQTIGYELAEQAAAGGHPINHVYCPAGGGGLMLAVRRGFAAMIERGRLDRSPAIHCVQPEGNDTIAGPMRAGAEHGENVTSTTTISGLQVGMVLDGNDVIAECRPTGGTGYLPSDAAIYEIQKRLAEEEGIFAEPAGATAAAAVLMAAELGELKPDDHAVALVTGSGFKDPHTVDQMIAGRDCPTITHDQIMDR